MKTARRQRAQNKTDNTRKTAFGMTEFAIPMFGYKAALFMFVSIYLIMWIIPSISAHLVRDPRWMNMLLCAPLCGISVGYAQYFVTQKTGFGKGFIIVSGLFTVCALLVLFLIYYAGKLA